MKLFNSTKICICIFFIILSKNSLIFASRFTPEQKARAVQKVRDGQKPAQVAREMNTSRQNIHNWVAAAQKKHFTPEQKIEAIQILKEEIEDITMNLPNFIPDVLSDLKNLFKRYLYNEVILLEEKKELLTLLEEVKQELSSDERIDLKTRTEIDNHMKDINYLFSLRACQISLSSLK